MITTRIDRVVFLDEAVKHVPLDSKAADGTVDPKRGSVQINRVKDVVGAGIDASKIAVYETTDISRSKDLRTGQSAKVRGVTYFDLNQNCMIAIGAARLVQDAMSLDPNIASLVRANPGISD